MKRPKTAATPKVANLNKEKKEVPVDASQTGLAPTDLEPMDATMNKKRQSRLNERPRRRGPDDSDYE